MIIGIGIAVTIYLALLYVAPGPDKSLVGQAPVNGAPKVFRNLALAIVGLILADGVVFHSSFYTTVLKPKSHAGVVANHLRAEKRRPRIADKEILVIGDSRVEQGFDNEIANEMARGKGVAFIERAVPASGHDLSPLPSPERDADRAVRDPLLQPRLEQHPVTPLTPSLAVLRASAAPTW